MTLLTMRLRRGLLAWRHSFWVRLKKCPLLLRTAGQKRYCFVSTVRMPKASERVCDGYHPSKCADFTLSIEKPHLSGEGLSPRGVRYAMAQAERGNRLSLG